MAFIKKFYLHPKLRSWSLLKLFSIYAHSSIEASLRKSSWNSSHNQLNQLHGSTLRADTQFTNTFSLQKGPCWSFEVNKPGKQTIFQHFSEVDFLAALEEVLKFSQMFSLQLTGWRVFMSRWFSLPIVLPGHRGPSHPFKIKERACFVFLAAMFIFRARGTCGLLVQGLEPRF